MFVLGTAGHIDHGKSSIIIRLTGIDPDRLPEEKQRGMTIDLGFAWYDTQDGGRIGIVDVPGHERFVRNMIAGAGGIDAVLLVIAADDGWMPQTQEHFQITRLLGIKYGIIALSKIDLVDPYWAEMVIDDIKEKVLGSYLEGAPILRVSSLSGEGFPRLRLEIDRLAARMVDREDIGKPRLYIDRSFILSGMGGVATGTLRGGRLSVGQEISIFPSKIRGKIRTLQSHNRQVEETFPGQRTAASFTGLDKELIIRGGVISSPEIIENYPESPFFAISINVIEESPFPIEDRRRLLMTLGTTEVEGEIRLMKEARIFPGQTTIAFFKPYSSVLAFIGDRFIFRLPTPQITVGGGEILGFVNSIPGRKGHRVPSFLNQRIELTPENLVASELSQSSFVDINRSLLHSNFSKAQIKSVIEKMESSGLIKNYSGKYYRPEVLVSLHSEIQSLMKTELDKRPHRDGLTIDQIAHLLGRGSSELVDVLELMITEGRLVRKKNHYDLPGRTITVKGELKQAADKIEQALIIGEFSPPGIEELISDDKTSREAFEYLVLSGKVVKTGGRLAFHTTSWNEMIKIIRQILDSDKELTVGFLREKLGSSRKFVVPVLEETDRLRLTERRGDIRVKGEKYDQA